MGLDTQIIGMLQGKPMQHVGTFWLFKGNLKHMQEHVHFLASVFIMRRIGLRRRLLQGSADGMDLGRAELDFVGHDERSLFGKSL